MNENVTVIYFVCACVCVCVSYASLRAPVCAPVCVGMAVRVGVCTYGSVCGRVYVGVYMWECVLVGVCY